MLYNQIREVAKMIYTNTPITLVVGVLVNQEEVKRMRRLVISPITNEIYWATVKQDKNDPTWFELTGNKEQVTKQALDCVYQWFLVHAKQEADGQYAIRFAKNAWLRMDLKDIHDMPLAMMEGSESE